jgi:hypothetical protein
VAHESDCIRKTTAGELLANIPKKFGPEISPSMAKNTANSCNKRTAQCSSLRESDDDLCPLPSRSMRKARDPYIPRWPAGSTTCTARAPHASAMPVLGGGLGRTVIFRRAKGRRPPATGGLFYVCRGPAHRRGKQGKPKRTATADWVLTPHPKQPCLLS